MTALHLSRPGVALGMVSLCGIGLASCAGSVGHRVSSSPKKPAATISVIHEPPSVVATGLLKLTTTPVLISMSVHERSPGVDRNLTVHAAWDPIDHDGEVATIGANAGLESSYGASRVVNGHAWSLIGGHWYRVGFGQQVIGELLAVVDAIKLTGPMHAVASRLVGGTDSLGFSGSFSKIQLMAAERYRHVYLSQAFVDLHRLSYTVYVGGSYLRGLDITAVILSRGVIYRTQWNANFASWGTSLQVLPPPSGSVFPGSAPVNGLLPL